MDQGVVGVIVGLIVLVFARVVVWPWIVQLVSAGWRASAPPPPRQARPLGQLSRPSARPSSLSLSHPENPQGLSVKWTDWDATGPEISREYSYLWPGDSQPTVLRVMLTLERGTFQTFSLWNFYLTPRVSDEETYIPCMISVTSDDTTGFFVLRTTPHPDGPSLLNIEDREIAEALLRLFLSGQDMTFELPGKAGPALRVPLPNDIEFRRHFESVKASLPH